MRLIGREDDLAKLNRKALEIARQVADETGTLMAGNLSNTTFKPDDPDVIREVEEMYKVCNIGSEKGLILSWWKITRFTWKA